MAGKTLRHRDLAPAHPGAYLREIVLPDFQMSVQDAAARLLVTRQNLYRLINEKIAVSPEMALRLSRFVGNSPEHWLNMQQAYDLWHAERALREKIARIRPAKAA